MTERFTIHLIGGEDDEQATLVMHDDAHDPCRLTFEYSGMSIDAEERDFFEAL